MTELEKTLFIPLLVRANESKRNDALFIDSKAIQLCEESTCDSKRYDGGSITTHGIVARTVYIDTALLREIAHNEPVTIINIGCGLDTRPYRLAIPDHVTWYDVDLPDVIRLRREHLSEKANQTFIEGSILEDAWHASIEKKGKVLIVIEGVLVYFAKTEIETIFNLLHTGFAGALVIFDVLHPVFVGNGITSPFKWGVSDIAELNEETLHIRIIDHKATGELSKKRESLWFRMLDTVKMIKTRSQIIEAVLT